MNRIPTTLRLPGAVIVLAALTIMWIDPAGAYDDPYTDTGQFEHHGDYDDGASDIVMLAPDQLDELVGPIALYPDDLLAIALPASTYPLDIVEAARFLDKHETDSSLQPSDDWDESVMALLNYPEVVRMMNDDIDWTWQLGGAVLNQQPDVIEAVERFRDRAYAAGNLKSDEYQTVSNDGDSIEILPVEEEVIYVPYYEPRQVVIRQVEPVYYYYPRPRPVYYYPYPAGHFFFDYGFWGVSTAYRIGWSTNYLNVWHYTFSGHPYFGHRYSSRYYRQPTINIYNTRYVNSSGRYATDRHRYGDRWRPRRHGVRPVGDRPRNRVHRDSRRPDGVAHDARTLVNHRSTRRDDRDYAARRHNELRRPAARDRNARGEARPEIRFRERPETVTANVRRNARSNSTEDLRRRNRYAASTRSARDAAALRNVETRNTRRTAERNADRPNPGSATPVARTRTTMTHNTPAVRKPATRGKPPTASRERRPDNRASGGNTAERKPRAEAKERESRTERKPRATTKPRHRR